MMDTKKNMMTNELSHYGVKGMRWGHHKRQESENVQNARRRKVEEHNKYVQEKKKYNKATAYGIIGATKNVRKRRDRADKEYRYAKEDLKNAKILDKINSKPKSKGTLLREAKYKAKGYSDDEAAIKAYKFKRNRNRAIAAAAIAATYVGYKTYDNRKDKIIKTGEIMGVVGGVNAVKNASLNKKVETYRQANPGTSMTNTEIARMIERNRLQ